MLKKQLGLIFGITLTSIIYSSATSAVELPPAGNTGGVTVFRYFRTNWGGPILPNQSRTLQYPCPTNMYVVNGGIETQGVPGNSANGFHLINSYPFNNNRWWKLRVRNTDDVGRMVRMYIVCAQ